MGLTSLRMLDPQEKRHLHGGSPMITSWIAMGSLSSDKPGACKYPTSLMSKMGLSENSVPHLPNGFADHYPY